MNAPHERLDRSRPRQVVASGKTGPNAPRGPGWACLSLGVLLLALFWPPPAQAIWPFNRGRLPDVEADRGRAGAEILAESIRISTVNPPGDERALARYFVDLLKEGGVEARMIDTPDGDGRGRRAAAWARVKGDGSKRPVVLLSHLDVVPASPSGWAVNPFEGVIVGGFVIGRGALDAKGVGVVHLLTLLELASREEPLERDVIFLATPDEEAGGRYGAGYLVRERRSLLYDAEYLLTEGGGIAVGEAGSLPIWGVTVTEKAPCWMKVTASGPEGHSSAAPRVTAVTRLLDALTRVRGFRTEIRVVPEVQRMFAALAHLAPAADREGLADLAAGLENDPAFRSRFLDIPGRNALVRNTLAISVLEGAPLTNVIPGEASAHLDARLLPGEHCADFVADVRRVVGDPEVTVEPLLSFTTSSSPVHTPLFRAIESVADQIDPGAPVVPRVIAGFTDAHYFRDLGVVAYGFVPRWLPPSETRGIHGPNERISTENLDRGVGALTRILETLDQLD